MLESENVFPIMVRALNSMPNAKYEVPGRLIWHMTLPPPPICSLTMLTSPFVPFGHETIAVRTEN